MKTKKSSALEQPIIPLAVINSIISQLPGLYSGKFPIRDPNAPRHCSHASRSSQNRTPRPSNSFILFRSFFARNKDVLTFENKHQDLSMIAGKVWKSMSKEEKKPWYDEALKVKEEHRQAHPKYQYSPSPVKPTSEKRKVRKGNSEEEKNARRLRCDLAATQIRQAMPGACATTDGNESDGVSETSAVSNGSSSAISSSSGSGFNASISSESSPSGTGPIVIDTAPILPSKRNSGVQRTTGWLANLNQQSSLVPPSSSQTVFTRSSAPGTINPANLRLANPVNKPSAANVWGLRDGTGGNAAFTTPSLSSSPTAFTGPGSILNSGSSTFGFGQSGWSNTAPSQARPTSMTTSTFSVSRDTLRRRAPQPSYADSDDEYGAANHDNDDDGMDQDSDNDY